MKSKLNSDWKCLLKLNLSKGNLASSLDETEIYKACVAVANNGGRRIEERELPSSGKLLLESRRLIKLNRFQLATQTLNKVQAPADSLYSGDVRALTGIIQQRLGNLRMGSQAFAEASLSFANGGDYHRSLRALTNLHICETNLESFLSGDLFGLERECLQNRFFDLAANIQKARAVQLMDRGRFAEALPEAVKAVSNYEQDGCPEDAAVAKASLAILYLLNGKTEKAQTILNQVHLTDGQVAVYQSAARALIGGQTPRIPKGHPLDGVPWPVQRLKSDSVTGKILTRLRVSPAKRDELIAAVWGPRALSPAYCARLYSAIKDLRSRQKISIIFDGNCYRIA